MTGCSDDGPTDQAASSVTDPSSADDAPSECSTSPATGPEEARRIADIANEQYRDLSLLAALVRVERGGEEVTTLAIGDALPGTPVTAEARFRNGAVSIAYLATALLQLVDEGQVDLDDTIDEWLPALPHADEVTLRMLVTSTSGYRDYEATPSFVDSLYDDPFRTWTPEELIEIGVGQPLWYEPGTSFNYAHTNFVILGRALEAITGMPTDELLTERFLEPAGLDATIDPGSPLIPEPALHAYTDERGLYEESTYWNPSWTLAEGAIQVTTICDLARSAGVIGRGDLISTESHELQVGDSLVGLGGATETCPDACLENIPGARFGYGVVLLGDWVVQTPMFHGYAAVQAYLPADDLSIAVAVTQRPGSPEGNQAQTVLMALAAELAPDHSVGPG